MTSQIASISGSFINSGPYSCFIAFLLPVVVRLYRLSGNKVVKLLCISNAFFACFLIPLLLSRTAIFAGVTGVLIAYSGQFADTKNKLIEYCAAHKKSLISLFILIFALGLFFTILKLNSAHGRLLIWKIIFKYINFDILLHGVGWSNVAVKYAEMQEQYVNSGMSTIQESYLLDTPLYLFNEYIHCLMAFGILSFVALMIIGYCIIIFCNKHKLYGIFGATVGVYIVMFFSYPLHCWEFWAVIAIFGINALICVKSYFIKFMVIILISACVYCGYYNYNIARKQGVYFNIAIELYNRGLYSASNMILKENIEQISPDINVLYLIAKNYYNQGEVELAKIYLKKASSRVPHLIYPHYKLMQIYSAEGDIRSAQNEANIIINKKPKVKSQATEEMKDAANQLLHK